MPKRLAITISGAVSLGSYEAGVLYEVVNAIGQHNSQPDTNTALNETDQIGPIRYPNPEPLRAIDVQLDGLTLDRMDRQPREQVRDRLCDSDLRDAVQNLFQGFLVLIGGVGGAPIGDHKTLTWGDRQEA
jgi:hypothetical protein